MEIEQDVYTPMRRNKSVAADLIAVLCILSIILIIVILFLFIGFKQWICENENYIVVVIDNEFQSCLDNLKFIEYARQIFPISFCDEKPIYPQCSSSEREFGWNHNSYCMDRSVLVNSTMLSMEVFNSSVVTAQIVLSIIVVICMIGIVRIITH